MAHHTSSRGYVFDLESNRPPVAVVSPPSQEAVVGAIVRLDGRVSADPEHSELTYHWSFAQVPIGSQVERDGFVELESDGSVVTFAPDLAGHYQIQLIVNDGSLDSEPATGEVDTRLILVPNHQGLVPDASFIWRYLSDTWNIVADRKRFEVFWSAAIQIIASELLRLYQYDYNKSIRDIQRLMQRRWLSYSPQLVLDSADISFILADDQAGANASTTLVDPTTGVPAAIQPDYSNMVSVPATEGNFVTAACGNVVAKGRILRVSGRTYTLARSGPLARAVNYGVDGSTVPAPGDPPFVFHGSGFRQSHVGHTLRLLDVGVSYVIGTVLDSATVSLTTAPPWPPAANLNYVVLAPNPESAFFADRDGVVPTNQFGQSWRFSATMISASLDFEEQGVAQGDVIEVQVRRKDTSKFATLKVQVAAVDRNRLGFVLNLEPLVSGRAADGLSDAQQVALADALQVAALTVANDGTLAYSDEAATIARTVRSLKFKRTYYERALTAADEINVGPFAVTFTPQSIVRNRTLPLAPEVRSLPVLQEYIRQPETITREGKVYQVVGRNQYELDHVPRILVENLDYIIDDEGTISGVCNTVAGNEQIEIPYGDLIDRNIRPGDLIHMTLGPSPIDYNILQVLDAENVRVRPVPIETATGVRFQLKRRVTGRYLRFIENTYTPKTPAPARLWAEISYIDNVTAIQGNFGALVGLTAEQLQQQEVSTDYRSAVAGLMYGLATGPTLTDMELAGQILLGLPFAENAGVITEINEVYRRGYQGEPLYGRILIEARDQNDQPTGITNLYFYPHGRQIELEPEEWTPTAPDFSGRAINPDTGVEYQVGDRVTQFAKLSKGVKIEEYLTTPSWYTLMGELGQGAAIVRKYHSFRLVANADVVRAEDIDLAAQYLQETRARQARMLPSLLQLLPDYVRFTDELLFSYGRPPVFFDTPGFGLPMAVKFDADMSGDCFYTFEGRLYSRYISGTDLITVQASSDVTSPAGGFITARAVYGESHDSPYLRAGDILEIEEGSNRGRYPVRTTPTDDTILTLALGARVFESLSSQIFTVYRPVENPFFHTQIQTIDGSPVATIEDGCFSAGVAIGDLVVFYDPDDPTWVSPKHVVQSFNPSTHQVALLPVPTKTGTYTAMVVREGLLSRYLTEDGVAHHVVSVQDGNPWAAFVGVASRLLSAALLRPGDSINFPEGDTYTVQLFDPVTLQVLVTPTPVGSRTDPAVLSRDTAGTVLLTSTILDHTPGDFLELVRRQIIGGIPASDLLTTMGSDLVTTDSGMDLVAEFAPLPGKDYLVIDDGVDAGKHVILECPDNLHFRLGRPLTATAGPIPYHLERWSPNER